MDGLVDPQGCPERISNNNNNGDCFATPIDLDPDERDPLFDPMSVVSVDPGTMHCAVVRYDAGQDRFTRAELLNLFCTCEPDKRGRGALALSLGSAPGGTKKKKPKPKVPTAHDFPDQLASRVVQHREGLFAPFDLMALERQNAMDTGNMVIESALKTRYGPKARFQAPKEVKLFWNRAAASVPGVPVCFRTGSHSVNKTDSKRLGPRVFAPSEQAMLVSAARRHWAHKQVCPTVRLRGRKGKRKRNKKKASKGTPKVDDLYDAAYQAIYAIYDQLGIQPESPEGPAARRLARWRSQPPPAKKQRRAGKSKRGAKK